MSVSATARPISAAPDEARARVDERVAGRDDEADEQPDHRRGREEAEVGRPVARFHDQRV